MAIVETKLSIAELRKKLGKTAVVYPYRGKIILRSCTNINSGKYIKHRENNRKMLTELGAMAKLILTDPVKKAEYESIRGPLQSATNVLVGELIKTFKSKYHGNSI
jgi:hypothetical protein